MRLYGEFTKTERRPDGSVVVAGVCSSESTDSQGERVLASAMLAALPDYWRLGPAVREMHDPLRAVGTGLAAEVDADGRTHFECLVVDPVAVAKITSEPPVLRGFSIGGTVPPGGRDPSDPRIIRALTLTEISLVDRGSNPDARIELWKADANPIPREADVKIDVPRAPGAVEEPAHRCLACGTGLTCPKCTAGADAEKVAKMAGAVAADSIGKANRERDDAIRKLATVEGARDALAKRAADAERELARRPKGALKAVPVSKAADTGMEAREEPEPATALDAIRAAHRRPRAT